MAYVFTFWTCYSLYKEYIVVTDKRLHFLASPSRCTDQFTVLVRNFSADPDESVSEHVEHFFCLNHPDQYLVLKADLGGSLCTRSDISDLLIEIILNYFTCLVILMIHLSPFTFFLNLERVMRLLQDHGWGHMPCAALGRLLNVVK